MINTDTFARIRPIVGHGLQAVRVAIYGLAAGAPLVHYLAASGVARWLVADDGRAGALAAALHIQHGPALPLAWETSQPAAWVAAVASTHVDLALIVDAPQVARALPNTLPRLYIGTPTAYWPTGAALALPGESLILPPRTTDAPAGAWAWLTSAPLAAGLARAVLLRDSRYARPDLAAWWGAGMRGMAWGWPDDPGQSALLPSLAAMTPATTPAYATPCQRRGTLLVVGLGSLGSIAAQHLAPWVARLLLVDPDVVEPTNPVRQAYPCASVGAAKATMLAGLLTQQAGPEVIGLVAALTDEEAVRALIEEYDVSAALVTTGTQADFAIARALYAAGLPHLVGRCYPRARYWEGVVVAGPDRLSDRLSYSPSYADVRGAVMAGPWPLPTPEEQAAYGHKEEGPDALEAEPATLIESGWAAVWLARIMAQLLAPAGLREHWFLAQQAAEARCVIGGVSVEPTPSGPAYGIAAPGQVRAWSMAAIGRPSNHGEG